MKKSDYQFNVEEMKKSDKKYLKELQTFFDKVDNIEDDDLKSQILHQMHLCEQRIIKMCEEVFNKTKKS